MANHPNAVRTVVFNAEVTKTDAIDCLLAAKTHSKDAVDTYQSYRLELCEVAAEVSYQTRRIPLQSFFDFVHIGDLNERRDRYAALRTAEILAYEMGNIPSEPLRFPDPMPESDEENRVLRPLEIGLARFIARTRNFRKGTVNLAVLDAGGSAGDLPHMTPDRVDITPGTEVFHLPETARSTGRTLPIPPWAIPLVSHEWNEAVKAGRTAWSIGYTMTKTRVSDVQSAGLMTIKPILDHAGLRFDGTVTPSSIRNTRAHEVFTESGIFGAAEVLGARSLDQAAAAIGLAYA